MTRHHLRAKLLHAITLAGMLSVGYTAWAAIVITGHLATREKSHA